MKAFFKQFKNSTKKKNDKGKGEFSGKNKREGKGPPEGPQCFECYGFGHYAQECVNKIKKKALVTKTWDDSDSDKSNEEQGVDENDKRNFLAFGVSLNSHDHSESSGSETDDSDADSCDDIDEVREKYNKLHVFSKKLIEASEKLSDKIKKLENTLNECAQERDERNKEIELLLEKNKALAASTKSKDKSKDDIQIGTKVLDHILSIQRRPNDRSGLGYHATPSNPPIGRNGTKDKKTNANYMQNMISPPTTKKQMTAEVNGHPKRKEVKFVKFVPTCHYCGVTGHIRPHCKKMHESHSSHAHVAHPYGHNYFVPICHHCGIKGHIRPYCFALHGYHRTPPRYPKLNNRREYFQRPNRKMPSYANFTKVNSKPMTTNVEKDKTRQIWVRKTELVSNVDNDLDSLDEYSSSGEVDLAF
ncbi:hypothetical protein RHGRI_024771 [Rhododendron griersonianum]|uniref:CCHC-type domain-containing protein n=1 Tax=Rhododendron griersonianum TaxID=479676 RepID=A0AAV6JC82_9ERIC|nr:hypothetical protein RHGRI_024771 [Rhododendron griersonianum]